MADHAESRLSINLASYGSHQLPAVLESLSEGGVRRAGLWRESIRTTGVERVRRLLSEHGIEITSLCRGGFFAAESSHEAGIADSMRALEEAAEIGAPVLVLLVGGVDEGPADLSASDDRIARALDVLCRRADRLGVRLALEPLHPGVITERSVINTLRHALRIAGKHDPAALGVMIDVFGLWWDRELRDDIGRAGDEGRIAGFQVSDWPHRIPRDIIHGRMLMGDGVIDLAGLTNAVSAAGYAGPVEVEIFSPRLWARAPSEITSLIRDAFERHIAPSL